MLFRSVEGVIFSSNDIVDAYNIPNELIAKRIAENSGDYIVKPYTANFELDSENTHILLKVSDGIAVVDGFRAVRNFPTTIRLKKPSNTKLIDNDVVGVNYGNYVIVNPGNDSSGNTPNITTLEKLNLKPEECLAIEDTEESSNAAVNASVKCIAFPGDFHKEDKFDMCIKKMNLLDQTIFSL